MVRGAFSNPDLVNELAEADAEPAYIAAQALRREGIPLVVIAGRNYGAGSSRDWAAKAPALLGVRAIVAEGFERLHRSNLIGMGIVPLLFLPGATRRDLDLDGTEMLDFDGLDRLAVGMNDVTLRVRHAKRGDRQITLRCRLDSRQELEYLHNGGLLPFVLRSLCERQHHLRRNLP
jgi:aconitate hydratase